MIAVKTIVVDKLGVEESEVEEDSSFVENLKADSLDLVELIMAFEEEFSTDEAPVEISDEDAGNIFTVKDAVVFPKRPGRPRYVKLLGPACRTPHSRSARGPIYFHGRFSQAKNPRAAPRPFSPH